VKGSVPNTSGVSPSGCYNKGGFQNLSLLTVSKIMSGKLIKIDIFLGFEPFLLSISGVIFSLRWNVGGDDYDDDDYDDDDDGDDLSRWKPLVRRLPIQLIAGAVGRPHESRVPSTVREYSDPPLQEASLRNIARIVVVTWAFIHGGTLT